MKILKTILLGGLVSLITIPAQASKFLFFSPNRVEISDADKVEVVNITNLSEEERSYTISTEDLIMTPEGVTAPVENFDYSAKRMIRFVPRQFTLKPGERQAIRVMGRIKGDVPDGDYHTHMKFLEDISKRKNPNQNEGSQAATISAPMSFETMIPVIYSHGKVDAKISFDEAKISKSAKKIKIHVKLGRSGNGQGVGYLHTLLVDDNGNSHVLTPRRTVNIYRELNQRDLTYDFMWPEGLAKSGKISLKLRNTKDNDANPIATIDLDIPK